MKSIACLVLVLSLATQNLAGFSWEPASIDRLPDNKLELSINGFNPHHFCKLTVDAVEYVGIVPKSGGNCTVASDSKVHSAKDFAVLTATTDQETGWAYCTKTAPSNALTCDLKVSKEGDCFFGQSLYGDGVCDESLGYIKGKFVYMAVRGKVSRCPFKLYLVSGEANRQERC